MDQELLIFKNGSKWVRADFHLHTVADTDFDYVGDHDLFAAKYIAELKEQEIHVGVITNHNKFDKKEFKELRKFAKREEIYLLPGVEFSCRDGSRGVHILIVFDYEWIDNNENKDYINDFLTLAFAGIANYNVSPYPNSKFSFSELIHELDQFEKDYFIVLAHIDDDNGIFKEMTGRNLEAFIQSEAFSKKVLGLQKSRRRDNKERIKQLLNDVTPAFVEGTDNAGSGIDGIGKGNEVGGVTQKTYIKVGDYNFEAIKFALIDHKYRVANNIPSITNGFIKSLKFQGGKLDNTQLYFNHSMNNLIGIRGSGKSAILEAIRYVMDIPITEKENADYKYKTGLLDFVIGSGGKLIVDFDDDQGNSYEAEKIFGESTKVYKDGIFQHGLKISSVVQKAIYFGQKDLSQIGSTVSTEYLINKLIGNRLAEQKNLIEQKNYEVKTVLSDIDKTTKSIEQKPDIEEKKAELENNIQKFKDYKIDKKLDEQISFNKDKNQIKRLKVFESEIIEELTELINEYETSFISFENYETKYNKELFIKIYTSFNEFKKLFESLSDLLNKLISERDKINGYEGEFNENFEELKEKFAEIKREIDLPNIQADDYVLFTKELDITKAKLNEIDKLTAKNIQIKKRLQELLTDLQDLWHEEFKIIEQEIKKININQNAIEISVKYKGNKEAFKSFLRSELRGSGVRESNIDNIVGSYNDLIEVYNDLLQNNTPITNILSGGNLLNAFKEYMNSNLTQFLTFRIPDFYDITYRGRDLFEHSLGQRASALIIFLLTLKDSHLVIIDQPEDDLDNQTIYDDVIKVLRTLKNESQFVFATHNPNIPVLGDCEQIISCRYRNNKIMTRQGSIDNIEIRNDIVDIMEGGQEAFNQRKRIYELWKH